MFSGFTLSPFIATNNTDQTDWTDICSDLARRFEIVGNLDLSYNTTVGSDR